MDRLRWHLSRAAEAQSLDDLRRQFREQHGEEGFGSMTGCSAKMRHVYHLIARVAPSDAPVLVSGESGTGKELVARTLHDLSPRAGGPFVSLNCGALPQHLVESELFGHEKGSFTGADRTHRGVFERAAAGTLFLDEIAEMPLDLQVRLLRVLESGMFRRVGGERDFPTDVRIVAATNRPLLDAIEDGDFREDLFYRLEVFPIDVPPLRERGDDIVLLAEHFLADLNRSAVTPKSVTPALLKRFRGLPWPGNVRQLKNAVQRLYLLADRQIGTDLLPSPRAERQPTPGLALSVGMSIAEAERKLIEATMERLDGNKTASAEMLGLSLKTLYNRIKAYRPAERSDEP